MRMLLAAAPSHRLSNREAVMTQTPAGRQIVMGVDDSAAPDEPPG